MAESLKVVHGDLNKLPQAVREFVIEKALWCTPDDIWLCDGSHVENATLLKRLMDDGMIKALPKYDNCWLAHTDPADVARVEKFTFICTPEKQQTTPLTKPGVEGKLANWMSPERLEKELAERFPGCMKGRTMYVIPFSMGPIGSPVSKIGIELTDSAYVVVSMRIMTRIGAHVLEVLGDGKFVRSTHSVGRPLPLDAPVKCHWPCNPEKVLVVHVPANYEIFSYGSGYGGNSLLGKKCFALRLGSTLAREEGWLAEHMLILGLTNPRGETKYVVAAFPSCSGKTNLAMITPSLPGWTATCVGDDIAWMWFDDDGLLRAVNPENGFFGVAPGTSDLTNHVAMATIFKDTIFTNVAETSDGGVWWEGMEEPEPGVTVTSWLGETNWTKAKGTQAAHPNSRFCTPARNCPIIDANWENPKGVPISAILFGGRRPKGVPLVHEALTWQHGVFLGAAMRSEATAAAEFKGKVIMHDPFAMRPFFGYNFGEYCKHWISFEYKDGLKLPKIFYVNWFRTDENNKFLWPGFGDNVRVMEWIFRRCDGEDCAVSSAIGYLPHEDSLHLEGLTKKPDMHRLFDVRKAFWEEEIAEIEAYFAEQVGDDTPKEIIEEIENLKKRIAEIH